MKQEFNAKNTVLTILQNRNIPIKRETLRRMTKNINDRELRETIEQLVKDGYPIVNFQDGKGYLLSYNPADNRRMEKQEMARLKNISQRCKTYRKFSKMG